MSSPIATTTIAIRRFTGAEIRAAVDDLAALRISVFAAFPYLYDGDAGYEADYLHEFIEAPGGVLVAALEGERIVGAATASPMHAQKDAFRSPFEARGIDTATLFYFGESVLLPEYRGRGVGHAFFDHREGQALANGASGTTFAAVVRGDDHPARPSGYKPLDGFWGRRGYAPVAGLTTELAWKEHGEAGESAKRMQYWLRRFGDDGAVWEEEKG